MCFETAYGHPSSGTVRRPVTIEGQGGRVDSAGDRCAEVTRAVDAVIKVHVSAARRLLLFATQDHGAGQQPDLHRAGHVVELDGPGGAIDGRDEAKEAQRLTRGWRGVDRDARGFDEPGHLEVELALSLDVR